MPLAKPPFPVWANGRLAASGEAVLPADDFGYLLGLAVYDTLLFESGSIDFLEEHLARFQHSCGRAGISWPLPWDPALALGETAAALGACDAALRITASRSAAGSAHLVVTPRLLEIPQDPGVRLAIARSRKPSGETLEQLKSTNRLRNVLAREEAQRAGAFEALLLNDDGDLAEGTISNVFAVVAGCLCTPPTERGCLAGIVRGKVLEDLAREPLRVQGALVPLEVRRIEARELLGAQEVFLTNTTGRVIPIVEILSAEAAGRARIGPLPGSRGAVCAAIRARVQRLERSYRSRNNPASAVR